VLAICQCDSVVVVDLLFCSLFVLSYCIVIIPGSGSEITCNSQVGGHAVL